MDIRKKILSGKDKEIFEVFEELRSPFILRLIREFNCTNEDAEDIYQEAFMKWLVKMQNGELEVDTGGYLYGIGRNMLRMSRRKLKVYTEAKGYEDELIKDGYEDLEEWKGQTEKECAQLLEHLSQLSDACIQILKAVYFEKKSMADIATLLNYNSAVVVRATKVRCIKKLREIYNRLN